MGFWQVLAGFPGLGGAVCWVVVGQCELVLRQNPEKKKLYFQSIQNKPFRQKSAHRPTSTAFLQILRIWGLRAPLDYVFVGEPAQLGVFRG